MSITTTAVVAGSTITGSGRAGSVSLARPVGAVSTAIAILDLLKRSAQLPRKIGEMQASDPACGGAMESEARSARGGGAMVRALRLRPRQRLPLRPQLWLAAIAIFHWEAASHLGHSVFSVQTGKLPASKRRRVCPGVKQREKEASERVTKLAAVVRGTRSLSFSCRKIGSEFGGMSYRYFRFESDAPSVELERR